MEKLKTVLFKPHGKVGETYNDEGKGNPKLRNAERKEEDFMKSGDTCNMKHEVDRLPENNTPAKLNIAIVQSGIDTSYMYMYEDSEKDAMLDTAEIKPTKGLYPKLEIVDSANTCTPVERNAHVHADSAGRGDLFGTDFKTHNDGDFNEAFEQGYANTDFSASLKTVTVAGSTVGGTLDTNSEDGLEEGHIEDKMAAKEERDPRQLATHNNDQEDNSYMGKRFESSAKAHTGGKITLNLGTDDLNCYIKSEDSATYDEDKGKGSDVALADIKYSQDNKCAIKAKAEYTDLTIETENDQTRMTIMHAKAEGVVDAKSEGNAKLNIFENEVAEVGYNAQFDGDGSAVLKGCEYVKISNATCYDAKVAVCTGEVEGNFKGEAVAEAGLDVLDRETKLGVKANVKGDTKANVTAAEVEGGYNKRHKPKVGFRLIDGKTEGRADADGTAYLGKLGIGFETGVEAEAEHCGAKGNVALTKTCLSDANFTLGKANAKGKTKFGVNTKIFGEKFNRKYEVSGDVKVCGLDVDTSKGSVTMRPFPKFKFKVKKIK